jgi:hypothetical protein
MVLFISPQDGQPAPEKTSKTLPDLRGEGRDKDKSGSVSFSSESTDVAEAAETAETAKRITKDRVSSRHRKRRFKDGKRSYVSAVRAWPADMDTARELAAAYGVSDAYMFGCW